jgi:D-alanyl-D-alanine dipeptidase/CubicO group peptidase (beta-lactamase class C family)
MQCVDQGTIDLDAPVTQYVAGFQPQNPFDTPVTLRQMMAHQSGLVRESPVGNYFDPSQPSLADTIASLNETSLVLRPGTKTKYSNAAIAVVGAALESQTGMSHPDYVNQKIFQPLRMTASSFIVSPEVQPKLATGWMWTYDGRRMQAPPFLLGTGPAGNLYSSVNDLSKFMIWLLDDQRSDDDKILSLKSFKEMTTPIVDSTGKEQGFGLGFSVRKFDDMTKIGHGGAVYGFSTQFEALPQRRLGVVAASSLDGSNGVVGRLAQYALRLMIAAQDGKPLPQYRTTTTISPQRASQLIGDYRDPKTKRLVQIFRDADNLWIQLGTFQHQLRAATDDGTLLVDDVISFGTEVTLVDSQKIKVGETVYERIADEPPAECPSRWSGLIGEYGWDHNTLYIREYNGQLHALIEWFYDYPLTEVDENTFRFPDYGLYHDEGLKFVRDQHGNATRVIAAEVAFDRREVGTRNGETFKIKPVKPIEELRAAAIAATPPIETGDFRAADLVDLNVVDPTIRLDIRYATTNNFTGSIFYNESKALMQRPAAEAVARASAKLKSRGLGLLIHDAYRPWFVTKMFWDATPGEMKDFVANPANGSRHNRGCAVDLTLYDLATGQPIEMVAGYDEFSPRSFPLYPGGTSRQRWYRDLLRRTMESEDFSVYEYEWWHFDYKDWRSYRIGNTGF